MRRLADALLTTDPVQRIRLAHAGLAMLVMAAGVLGMHYFAWIGVASAVHVGWWSVASLGGMVVAYTLIRSGWSKRLRDPTLTLPQIIYALASGAVAYALIGPGRGAVFPIVMICLMFGLFRLRPAQLALASALAVLFLGASMAWMASRRPDVYVPAIEFGHFLLIATMMPAASILAARQGRLRRRLREQKLHLAQALARIEQLATRDELTGLVNRRHMTELMEQERQRGMRSGQTFCLAMIDIDHFKSINDHHGHAGGDGVLRGLAHEMASLKRGADVLARWGGEEFVLMLPDAGAATARAGVERLRAHVQSLRLRIGTEAVQVTISAGLAEHLAGESMAQTIERADRALYAAKRAGRDTIVLG